MEVIERMSLQRQIMSPVTTNSEIPLVRVSRDALRDKDKIQKLYKRQRPKIY